uniref:(northern house mosquito) hypothetical protein n=1 Tax=Culex pipiens TaxID=7175 RepID=A0A8D8BKS7_CULPI
MSSAPITFLSAALLFVSFLMASSTSLIASAGSSPSSTIPLTLLFHRPGTPPVQVLTLIRPASFLRHISARGMEPMSEFLVEPSTPTFSNGAFLARKRWDCTHCDEVCRIAVVNNSVNQGSMSLFDSHRQGSEVDI